MKGDENMTFRAFATRAKKAHGISLIFFVQTWLIWNILSAGSKIWPMGYYITYSFLTIEYKFAIKIEKSNYRTRANKGCSRIVAAPWKVAKICAFY